MKSDQSLFFKIASEKSEFDQIYKLNYRTFVEEIPQHEANSSRALIDRFDKENTYVICLQGKKLVGMMAVRGKRPFSLDEKLGNLDFYLPPVRSVCELRLLAVRRGYRNGLVFRGLARLLADYCRNRGYHLAIISGFVRQQKLYRALGFIPFGPLVGKGDATFQPMYLPLEVYERHTKIFLAASSERSLHRKRVNLLPGPVAISREVTRAFIKTPVSHRSHTFMQAVQHTKELLCQLVGARYVEILTGTGTLANDVIAGQLSLTSKRGLILSNGEFGDRLVDHATRFGLSFDVMKTDWGKVFDPDDVRRFIGRDAEIQWLWAVHCETSTGVLNDLSTLKEICAEREVLLCMDCVSSIGTVPIALDGVYLASGASGKGLRAFPGLSMVFHHHQVYPAPEKLPRYLDLGLYAAQSGVPFTGSSNLLHALQITLEQFCLKKPFDDVFGLSLWLRSQLRELGFRIVAPDRHASPAVVTIELPRDIRSDALGSKLAEAGYLLSYQSEYLLKRNWIQICLMGECSRDEIFPLFHVLRELCSERSPIS